MPGARGSSVRRRAASLLIKGGETSRRRASPAVLFNRIARRGARRLGARRAGILNERNRAARNEQIYVRRAAARPAQAMGRSAATEGHDGQGGPAGGRAAAGPTLTFGAPDLRA